MKENCLGTISIFWKLQMPGERFVDLDNLKSRPELLGRKIKLYSREL